MLFLPSAAYHAVAPALIPCSIAVQRYLDFGKVNVQRVFRTDFGSGKEAAAHRDAEWKRGNGAKGTADDKEDDVDILIRSSGALVVWYKKPGQSPTAP